MMQRADFMAMSGAAVLGLTGAGSLTSLAAAQTPANSGRTIFQPFPSAPFPHASRAGGHRYEGKFFDAATHYSDATVAIYIPAGFRAGTSVDYIVHFHGWNNNVRHVLERYRLPAQVDASGRNAILIVPQGPKDAPDSGDGKLELDEHGFARFMDDVSSWLARTGYISVNRIGRIVVTTHSGGYGGAGGVLTRGGLNAVISDVILFDSAYGYYDAFAGWTNASADNHLLSVFTDDTSTGNTALMARIQADQPNMFVRLGDTLTTAQLQTRAPTFILTTSIAHDDLLTARNWYAMFLQSTRLSAV